MLLLCLLCQFVLYVILALWPSALQFQLPAPLFVCVLFVLLVLYSNFIAGVPRRLFCFGSLVILDVVSRYLSLFLLYINIEIGKNRC